MKSILTTISLAFILAMSGFSQNSNDTLNLDYREHFIFGLKAGINYSNVYDAQGEEFKTDAKLGLAGGLFVAIPIIKFLGVQPEVLFSQKGFKGTGRLFGTSYELTRTTNYIDVPLYFALNPSRFFTILAGPQYSYLISQQNKFENAVTTIVQEQEFENDNIRKNTFCFSGGADIMLNHLVISGRAGWDILNNNGDGTSTTPRYKNAWYQLTAGYVFH